MDRNNPADRICRIQRFGSTRVTPQQRAAAITLLRSLLRASSSHGITLADWDKVTDLPAACLGVIITHH
ncbi:hypothetical protein [Streptomyces sp. NPDC053542]|uniref:hypothetical protein n=1 Tax=Streptomyces sp. NPDC053542 TaxID=3365710 RepID=UPI0037CE9F14